MSNGYIVAIEPDRSVAEEIADGFGLDLLVVGGGADAASVAETLAGAPNIGLLLTDTGAQDAAFVALIRTLAGRLGSAQLLVGSDAARAAFGLPEAWPSMSIGQALARAGANRAQRTPAEETPRAAPLPPVESNEPRDSEPTDGPDVAQAPSDPPLEQEPASPQDDFAEDLDTSAAPSEPAAPPADHIESEPPLESEVEAAPAPDSEPEVDDVTPDPPIAAAPPEVPRHYTPSPIEPPAAPTPQAPPSEPNDEIATEQGSLGGGARNEHTPDVKQDAGDAEAEEVSPAPPAGAQAPPRSRSAAPPQESAPADATAFAPKKLRRGTPELVRIVIHQPKDLAAVVKAARKIDPRTSPAPSGMKIGDVALGAKVGVSLEVRGAACDGAVQRRTWAGEPIDFSFSVEPDADVKQVVVLARIFVDDAQIGVLAFTRPVTGAKPKAADVGDKVRMKRHKRVFLSYSSSDRETVAAIATAYQSAGVEHFWDRASLKSGEEWSPRLRREIERADLFHLCWSKSAAQSEWVEKEAEYALTRRRRSNGKKPDITVQMLDGPPWAKHPAHLDSINFDDFVRAAIVGYARGDGES